jgi:hypothetical protein
MREHLEGLFPRTCSNCGRNFATLREFLQVTTHQGQPISYDAQAGNWQPQKPTGTMTFVNCSCGTTLALSSEGMPLPQLWRLLNWAKIETNRRGISSQALLSYLRDEICKQVLAGPGPENP